MTDTDKMALAPCPFCKKPPGTKVGQPSLARCITPECEGTKLDAETYAEWNTRAAAPTTVASREALRTAIGHIEHMAAFIMLASDYVGTYSFESINEDMPDLKAALTAPVERAREPVGYVNAVYLADRRAEYEDNGVVMTHQPFGENKMPLYALTAPVKQAQVPVTEEKPNAPKNSIRNLTPLYDDPAPSIANEALDKWIECSFIGFGVAGRDQRGNPIPGEPLMSMAAAKTLTRRAVAEFAPLLPPAPVTEDDGSREVHQPAPSGVVDSELLECAERVVREYLSERSTGSRVEDAVYRLKAAAAAIRSRGGEE